MYTGVISEKEEQGRFDILHAAVTLFNKQAAPLCQPVLHKSAGTSAPNPRRRVIKKYAFKTGSSGKRRGLYMVGKLVMA